MLDENILELALQEVDPLNVRGSIPIDKNLGGPSGCLSCNIRPKLAPGLRPKYAMGFVGLKMRSP